MTALSALPPAFLLPAWSHPQLIIFASRTLSGNTQCHFSTSRAQANEAVATSPQASTSQFTEVEHNGKVKTVRTYASKKERRLRENIEAINSRVKRYGEISSTTQSEAERRTEQRREDAILLQYNKKQRIVQDKQAQQREKTLLAHYDAKYRDTESINSRPLSQSLFTVKKSVRHAYKKQQGQDHELAEVVDAGTLNLVEELSSASNESVNYRQALEGNENGELGNEHHINKELKRTKITGSRTYQSLVPAAHSKRIQGPKLLTQSLKTQQGRKPEMHYGSKVDQTGPQILTERMGSEETAGVGSQGRSFRSIKLNKKGDVSLSEHSKIEEDHRQESIIPEKSLLEELFPEEAAKAKQQAQAALSERREAPKLPLPDMNDKRHENASINKAEIVPRRKPSTSPQPTKEIGALLILENALPDLIEADFRRVPPKGRHISEWNPIYNPTAIIPNRGGPSARCTGKYYLIFDSWLGAKAWRDRLQLLHRIVQQYTPTSLNSQIIPPKGFVSKGEDIGELLTEYSIFSQNTIPKMRLYGKPDADPKVKQEFGEVLARLKLEKSTMFLPRRSVLLWIDGWTVAPMGMIMKMINQNGRERHMLWNAEASKLPIEAYENDNVPRQEDTRQDEISSRPQQPKKWIITLQDEAEARRFIRVWHLKPFPNWPEIRPHDGDGSEEPWPVVRTELLW